MLFSGSVFVVAMFGMLLVPNSIMRSLAVGAILVGIVSVVAALTLLPAVLGLLGDKVNALRIPIVGRGAAPGLEPGRALLGRDRASRPAPSRAQPRALDRRCCSRSRCPVFRMDIGTSGVSALPDRFVSKQGFLALERDFPGTTHGPGRDRRLERICHGRRNGARTSSALASRPIPASAKASSSARRTARSRSSPSRSRAIRRSTEATDAVRELRSEIVPEAFAETDAEVLVGGTSSENIDYFDSVIDPAPYVIAFVLLLTFVLLTVVFRSIVVAGTAVALNLLSVGAAYGLLVLVFQEGVGADLLGFQQTDTIEAWVPLFLFSVLFGLSMDYQVFLLSRIRERFDQTRDTTDAVTFGVGSTARIITGAALIIVAVFSGFARGDLIMFQQMGFGVAVALLIDATIIRSVLLPSAMKLLGDWNWYLPRWLEWLPRLQVEGASTSSGSAPPSRRADASGRAWPHPSKQRWCQLEENGGLVLGERGYRPP